MAKISMIARNNKRIKIIEKYADRRAKLKLIISNINISQDEKWEAQKLLQKLPRNSSPIRRQRRCEITGRPHAVYRKFGLCRNQVRKSAMQGDIPGLIKASW